MWTVAYQGDQPPTEIDWATLTPNFWAERAATASQYLERQLPAPSFRTSFLPWHERWAVGAALDPTERDNRIRDRMDNPAVAKADFTSQWSLLAVLPAGRQVALREHQQRNGKPHLVVVVSTPLGSESRLNSMDGGAVDRDAVLPVRYHVPDGGGWTVAQRGQSLSYRTSSDGQWQDAGKDAALLPDNAVEVKAGDKTVRL